MGAACVRCTSQEGSTSQERTGRRYHLGVNKEIFDAETFAIYQAFYALDQRRESGHRYTVLDRKSVV